MNFYEKLKIFFETHRCKILRHQPIEIDVNVEPKKLFVKKFYKGGMNFYGLCSFKCKFCEAPCPESHGPLHSASHFIRKYPTRYGEVMGNEWDSLWR